MSDIPCMVCDIPSNCKKAGQCLAFTQRQDPEELLAQVKWRCSKCGHVNSVVLDNMCRRCTLVEAEKRLGQS